MSRFKFSPDKDIDEGCGTNNGMRAERAEDTLRRYVRDYEQDPSNAQDLISDLGHLCDREGWDFDNVLRIAVHNWRDER